MLLQIDLKNIDVLCLTEHWQNLNQVNAINVTNFKLVSVFCREIYGHGGSCIYVKEHLSTKETKYCDTVNVDKEFELTATELIDKNVIILCIYRSPDGNFDNFLTKLDTVIQNIKQKKKTLLLCGDWNVDFLQDSSKLFKLKKLFMMYNLTNVVTTPTRITKKTATLLDVMVVNNPNVVKQVSVIDMGFSDHFARVLDLFSCYSVTQVTGIKKRVFSSNNIKNFRFLLNAENWEKVSLENYVNSKFNTFLHTFLQYFNVAFPIKICKTENGKGKAWITKGIRICSKKNRQLSRLQKEGILSLEMKEYARKYRSIYRRVIKDAKRNENDRYCTYQLHRTKQKQYGK